MFYVRNPIIELNNINFYFLFIICVVEKLYTYYIIYLMIIVFLSLQEKKKTINIVNLQILFQLNKK